MAGALVNIASAVTAAMLGLSHPVQSIGTASERASAIRLHKIAVFGTDDRRALPHTAAQLKASIGLLTDQQSETVCSAFCVADRVIATARHCLTAQPTRRLDARARFKFTLVGDPRKPATWLTSHPNRSSELIAITGVGAAGSNATTDASRDWALVRLSRPICAAGALNLAEVDGAAVDRLLASDRVHQVGFHRDYGDWTLVYAEGCRSGARISATTQRNITAKFSKPRDLVLHQCDTGGASSGSPLLAMIGGLPSVVAINVGTYVETRLMMRDGSVVHRFKASAVANTGVAASAFRPFIAPLNRADILMAPRDIARAKTRLIELGFLTASRAALKLHARRAAIRAFQKEIGVLPTGLLTREVLHELEALSLRGQTD